MRTNNKLISMFFVTTVLSLVLCTANAQTVNLDSLYSVQNEELASLRMQTKKLKSLIVTQETRINNTESIILEQQDKIDSLRLIISDISTQIEDHSTIVLQRIDSIHNQSYLQNEQTNNKIRKNALWYFFCLVLLLCITSFIYFLLRKRFNQSTKSIGCLTKRQDKIEEDGLKLDNELLEILLSKAELQKGLDTNTDSDHSLALKVADEIVRIETNLSRMDPTIRGHKQLSASVRRIKDNFAANGYEFVDMLGKPYHEGMKVIANFIPDDTLPENAQIITGIIKPQINYNGVMIQAAQITVSQNI